MEPCFLLNSALLPCALAARESRNVLAQLLSFTSCHIGGDRTTLLSPSNNHQAHFPQMKSFQTHLLVSSVCVCMCEHICICTCMCVCMYMHLCVYMHMCMYVYVYVYIHACVYVYECVYVYACMCTYMHMCVCMCVQIHMEVRH